MSKHPSCVFTVKEANLNWRRLKAKHDQLFLDDSSDKNTINNFTKERDDCRNFHASQTNKNETLSRHLEGSTEKYKSCSEEIGRSHKDISGLKKSQVNCDANQCNISFMDKEHDSLKVRCDCLEQKAKHACENHVKHVTEASK